MPDIPNPYIWKYFKRRHPEAFENERFVELMMNPRRSNIWKKRVLYEIQNGLCGICDRPINLNAEPNSPGHWSLDHIKPKKLGNVNANFSNLRVAHKACNNWRNGKE